MRINKNLPDRKRNRIHGYDYSENGYYFVTICVDDMNINRFGEVKNGKMILNEAGKMVEEKLTEIPKFYSGTELDIFVVMPNHLHVILVVDRYLKQRQELNEKMEGQTQGFVPTKNNVVVGDDPRVVPGHFNFPKQLSVSEIVQRFKSLTTKIYIDNVKQNNWLSFQNQLWQRSFYDHVIRVEESLDKIRQYILNNPPKWDLDRNNPNRKPGKYYFEY